MGWTEEDVAAHYARLKQPPEGAKPAPSGHVCECCLGDARKQHTCMPSDESAEEVSE